MHLKPIFRIIIFNIFKIAKNWRTNNHMWQVAVLDNAGLLSVSVKITRLCSTTS